MSSGQLTLCTKETYLQKCNEIIQLKLLIVKVSPTILAISNNVIYFRIEATLAKLSCNSDDKLDI